MAFWNKDKKAAELPKHADLGRNDPCHCGSGKKYKKCCIDKDQSAERKVLDENWAKAEAEAKAAAEKNAKESKRGTCSSHQALRRYAVYPIQASKIRAQSGVYPAQIRRRLMDTLAHGLWGGAVFGQKKKGQWKWAFWLGMAPDLLSFGPFFLTHIPMIISRWSGSTRMEPPDPAIIPSFVYHAYNVTHSLVIWILLAAAIWAFRKQFPWVFCAWPLHILCDIPTHTTRFFPTPFLWPLPTPFVDGRPWSHPPFSSINYGLIALTYVGIYLYHRRKAATGPSRQQA